MKTIRKDSGALDFAESISVLPGSLDNKIHLAILNALVDIAKTLRHIENALEKFPYEP